jgi:DNA polymerase
MSVDQNLHPTVTGSEPETLKPREARVQFDGSTLSRTGLHIIFGTRSIFCPPKYCEDAPTYGQHWSTNVWCCAYANGDGPIKLWLPGQPIPYDVARVVTNATPIVSYDAAFQRSVFDSMSQQHGWPAPRLDQWHSSAAMAAALGLPADLEDAIRAIDRQQSHDLRGRRDAQSASRPRRICEQICPNCNLSRQELDEESPGRDGWGCIGETEPDECFTRISWPSEPSAIALGCQFYVDRLAIERDLLKRLPALSAIERGHWIHGQQIHNALINPPWFREPGESQSVLSTT